MYISDLQKYILKKVWGDNKIKVDRKTFNEFYKSSASSKSAARRQVPAINAQTKIVTQSIERLIDKGFLVGFGERTRFKWFIKKVKFTVAGKKIARKLMGEQVELPFKKRRIKKK
jgi:hypothetical protein